MLEFICKTCGKRVQGDESLAGKTLVCPACNMAITAPQIARPSAESSPATSIATPADAAHARIALGRASGDGSFREGLPPLQDTALPPIRKEIRHILLRFLPLLIVFGILLTCLGLLVTGVQKVRTSAARTQSQGNLCQFVLACHGFHDVNNRLPFNGADADDGKVKYTKIARPKCPTSGSWAFQVLPYIDQNPMYRGVTRTSGIACSMCPGRGRPLLETSNGGGAWTDYFYNNYLNDPMRASKPDGPDLRRRMVDIADGVSHTILLGHGRISTAQYRSTAEVTLSSNIFNGGTTGTMRSGDNVTPDKPNNPGGVTLQRDSARAPDVGSWGSPFTEGAWMALADGSVRMFPYTTENFSAFLTPTGREKDEPPAR